MEIGSRFVLFAALAMFTLKKAGGDVDMSGEKHLVTDNHAAPAAAPAASK